MFKTCNLFYFLSEYLIGFAATKDVKKVAERELKDRKKEWERREKRCNGCDRKAGCDCTFNHWPWRLMIVCRYEKTKPLKPRSVVRKGKYPRTDFYCPTCNKQLYGRPDRCECWQKIYWKKAKKNGGEQG